MSLNNRRSNSGLKAVYPLIGLLFWYAIFHVMIALYPLTLIFLTVGIYVFLPERIKRAGGTPLAACFVILYLVLVYITCQYVGQPVSYQELR